MPAWPIRTASCAICRRAQVDEIWNFVYAKNDNVRTAKAAPANTGDVWTWTAIDADTKLLISWLVADRTTNSSLAFMDDLKERLANRVQLTSDGHRSYLAEVHTVFGDDVDYAMPGEALRRRARREEALQPRKCIGAQRRVIHRRAGPAAYQHVICRASKSHDADAHASLHSTHECISKKVENHACAVALHSMYYNFVRIHQTLKVSPAMAAGVTDRLWEMGDVVDMLEAWESKEKRDDKPIFEICEDTISRGATTVR
jgi:IS1 family transposase